MLLRDKITLARLLKIQDTNDFVKFVKTV